MNTPFHRAAAENLLNALPLPNTHLRASGRTTRMILMAMALAKQGKRICVLCDNDRDALRLQHAFTRFRTELIDSSVRMEVDFKTPERVPDFDWKTFSSQSDKECCFLVDHHAIESRFHKVLQMLHAFDR